MMAFITPCCVLCYKFTARASQIFQLADGDLAVESGSYEICAKVQTPVKRGNCLSLVGVRTKHPVICSMITDDEATEEAVRNLWTTL